MNDIQYNHSKKDITEVERDIVVVAIQVGYRAVDFDWKDLTYSQNEDEIIRELIELVPMGGKNSMFYCKIKNKLYCGISRVVECIDYSTVSAKYLGEQLEVNKGWANGGYTSETTLRWGGTVQVPYYQYKVKEKLLHTNEVDFLLQNLIFMYSDLDDFIKIVNNEYSAERLVTPNLFYISFKKEEKDVRDSRPN